MFILTTVYTVANVVELSTGFKDAINAQEKPGYFGVFVEIGASPTVALIQNLSFSVSVVLGDAIILWRVLVIWAWRKCERKGLDATSPPDNWKVLWIVEVVYSNQREDEVDNALRLSFVSIPGSLVTSLWATGAISWKYWQERRKLSKGIIRVSRRSALENILAILTESGVVFTLLWATYFGSSLSAAVGEISDTSVIFNQAMTNVMVIAAPLYPTLIVILVARHKTPLHDQLTSIESRTVSVQNTGSQDFLVEEGYARDGDIALHDLQKEDFR